MPMERPKETEVGIRQAHSPEPSSRGAVREGGTHRRDKTASRERGPDEKPSPARERGRPRPQTRIHVVRIDAQKYPHFLGDREHPFASMAVEARIEELDSFCARLWARSKKRVPLATGHCRSAAA